MKKSLYSLIPAVIICGVLSTTTHAATTASALYSPGVSEIATEIHNLMRYTTNELCNGDLDIASAYVESAHMSLSHDKVPEALMSIDKGIYELTEIGTNRAYCHSIAQSAKHVLADLIRARGEIEAYMRLKLVSQFG